MAWTYKQFSATEAGSGLSDQVQNQLNALGSNQAVLGSVKLGSLNSLTYSARTAIFYEPSLTEIPTPNNLSGSWSYKTWTGKSDYLTLFQAVVDHLNAAGTMTDAQKYYSHVALTDRNSADATVTLWWRDTTSS
jgi:hypothetical protein